MFTLEMYEEHASGEVATVGKDPGARSSCVHLQTNVYY